MTMTTTMTTMTIRTDRATMRDDAPSVDAGGAGGERWEL
jgi:hypothetical protein